MISKKGIANAQMNPMVPRKGENRELVCDEELNEFTKVIQSIKVRFGDLPPERLAFELSRLGYGSKKYFLEEVIDKVGPVDSLLSIRKRFE